ncbi:MAG: DNA-binding protein, partial [Myxococcales bacterium]|nr:DNA-binding protein [Myxococcales bacterium]
MIVFESQKIRRIVGRLERGEALQASLKRLAQEKGITASWLSALGAFEWVELMEYDQHAQKYKAPKRIEECEILHLTGNLSFRKGENFAHVHASVSKEVGDRIEVYGGHLVDAQVFACELMIECLDNVVLKREY